jgi:hypothetical protein
VSVAKRDPYPLQWPDGWPRTDNWKRAKPKFLARFAQDRDSVIHQLHRRRASNIVITSDLPTRHDGLPYANAQANDPGIAVWWVEKGREQVMACDRWQHVTYNLRAIEMTLEALRGIDRWGSSKMVEQAFAGFAALPPGSTNGAYTEPPQPAKRSWHAIFGLSGYYDDKRTTQEDLLALAKARHRAMIREAHPDKGGDTVIAAELNVALAEAEKELG